MHKLAVLDGFSFSRLTRASIGKQQVSRDHWRVLSQVTPAMYSLANQDIIGYLGSYSTWMNSWELVSKHIT